MTDSPDTTVPPGRAAHAQLGTLLVEHGLLTPAQLQEALVEQERTGIPLGQTVVRLGYVSPTAVAVALATQRGGVAKTEFGMAVGFGTELPASTALPPVTTSERVTSYGELQAELQAAEARLDQMAEQMVAAARRIAELEVERDRALAQAAELLRVA